jgi:hypothetical protein
MMTPPERGEGSDRLGDLIRRTYSPPKDMKAPTDLVSRVVRAARTQPQRTSWLDHLYSLFESPFKWVPATAVVAALILAVGIALHPLGGQAPAPAPNVADSGASRSLPAAFTDEDPLGPDFFKTDEVVDEPVSVELAEGWNAVTIEDEQSNTALVYFYSKDEIENSTGAALPRTQ